MLFQIHSRANCRVGSLTSFTTEQLESYNPGSFIRSNEHKTGSIFTNFAYITEFEKTVLKELHKEYEEQSGVKPTSIFPGVKDNTLTTQSSTIARLMKNLFKITAYKFHPNACRKVWETYYDKHKDQIPKTLQKIFESNSGHSEKTRDKHYVAPPSDNDLEQLFRATHEIRVSFRKKREDEGFVSKIQRDMASHDLSHTELFSTNDPPTEPEPVCSTSAFPKIPHQDTDSVIQSKHGEQSGHDSDETSEMDTLDNDSVYKPPRSVKINRIPESNKKTRAKTEQMFDDFAKKMIKFTKKAEPHIEKPYRQACAIVASKRVKLSKANVRDIVASLNLNEDDTRTIFKKVYAKANNVYAALKI